MRPLLVLAMWVVATLGALAWAWQTKVGPVLVLVSTRHGVHLGDVVGFGIAYSWAAVGTLALTPERPGRRR